MSRIEFRSLSGSAEVSGSERAWLTLLCKNLFLAAMDLDGVVSFAPDALRKALPADHDLYTDQQEYWAIQVKTVISNAATSISGDCSLQFGGRSVNIATAALNTALAMGGKELQLAARITAQCEIHAFVEGPNRQWLAEIIESGLMLGIFRGGMGWENVVRLLRSSSDSPVVGSYSITDGFPSVKCAIKADIWPTSETMDEDEDSDASWYDLPYEEQWQIAMDALRILNSNGDGIELKPDGWSQYRFGDGLTGFDIMNHLKS